jgi:hypothetical protein
VTGRCLISWAMSDQRCQIGHLAVTPRGRGLSADLPYTFIIGAGRGEDKGQLRKFCRIHRSIFSDLMWPPRWCPRRSDLIGLAGPTLPCSSCSPYQIRWDLPSHCAPCSGIVGARLRQVEVGQRRAGRASGRDSCWSACAGGARCGPEQQGQPWEQVSRQVEWGGNRPSDIKIYIFI